MACHAFIAIFPEHVRRPIENEMSEGRTENCGENEVRL
jgi:hypothetical protein